LASQIAALPLIKNRNRRLFRLFGKLFRQREINMKLFFHARSCASLLLIVCLLATAMPVAARDKKGEKNFKHGIVYEAAQQWERAAQEFALAVAADPAQTEYQLHYRRAIFNASQSFMQKGRSLAEQRDYVGAYNSFRQAYGYDPVNQLALSEMERMLRLQREKEGMDAPANATPAKDNSSGTPRMSSSNNQLTNGGIAGASLTRVSQQTNAPILPPARVEQQRVITFSGDLLSFIRSLAERLDLNVVFDKDLESQRRNININLRDVTTSQALDYLFLVQNLFFQKLSRRTIIVADQVKRAQYQQLVIRTFYLENAKPEDVQRVIQQALPAQNGRPPTASIVNASTNSLTVRDTPENVRLIGELIRNIDKDRSEVVMDVAIYEVSHTDLIQFGNQIGDPSGSSINLGGTQNGFVLAGSRRPSVTQMVAAAGAAATTATVASPLALGAALILPSTSFNAFQSKQNTRLVYSNQIHAFDGEQSRARIGQRVPVVTAQTYPFGSNINTNQTGNTSNGIGFGGGGFPVVQYEETGLTIELTPQVFPNLDVQVKMNIVSKDVLNQSNTPTFTERTINGTARIQNNRTMMLVSVAQNKQSNGRAGLPILGGLPLLGYLFTAPRRDNVQSDIVITVTPRVLRSPAIEPRDEEMRPSGTFSTPTTESLEAVLQEADREDQLAAAQRAAQQPQPSVLASNNNSNTQTTNTQAGGNAQQTVNASPINAAATNVVAQPSVAVPAASQESVGQLSDSVPPAYVPAPKILMSSNADSSANVGNVGNRTEAVLRGEVLPSANVASSNITPLQAKAVAENSRNFVVEQVPNRSNSSSAPTSAAELRLIPEQQEMRVGDKRRLMLVLKTDAPLGLAVVTFRFDPHSIAVRNVLPVSLKTPSGTAAPTLAQSIDAANGVLLVSLTPPAGASSLTSAGVLLTLDIEAIGAGESAVTFDTNNTHIVATDGRDVLLQLVRSRITVKP
jgi:general secretion pathway protein D